MHSCSLKKGYQFIVLLSRLRLRFSFAGVKNVPDDMYQERISHLAGFDVFDP